MEKFEIPALARSIVIKVRAGEPRTRISEETGVAYGSISQIARHLQDFRWNEKTFWGVIHQLEENKPVSEIATRHGLPEREVQSFRWTLEKVLDMRAFRPKGVTQASTRLKEKRAQPRTPSARKPKASDAPLPPQSPEDTLNQFVRTAVGIVQIKHAQKETEMHDGTRSQKAFDAMALLTRRKMALYQQLTPGLQAKADAIERKIGHGSREDFSPIKIRQEFKPYFPKRRVRPRQ